MPAPDIHRLQPHPASPTDKVTAEVTVLACQPDLTIRYRINASPADISLPAPCAAGPADELWRDTCCEAFVAGADSYHEFNFSPSGAWAVYRFTDVRQRDDAYRPPLAPRISCAPDLRGFTLTADIPAALLPAGNNRHLGLTTVIKHTDGSLSYWALRHDGPRPDFHRPATFLIALDTA